MEVIRGQINLFIGQEYNTTLNIEEPTVLDKSLISAINYNNDLNIAIIQSYDIRAQDNSYRVNGETRKYKAKFNQAYQAIQDRYLDVQTENSRLSDASVKLNLASVKYSIGDISKIEYDNEVYTFYNQQIKVKTAEQDLLKAYTAYKWIIRGLNSMAN